MADSATKLSIMFFPQSKEQTQRDENRKSGRRGRCCRGGTLPFSYLAHLVHRLFLKSGSIYPEEFASLTTPNTMEGFLLPLQAPGERMPAVLITDLQT